MKKIIAFLLILFFGFGVPFYVAYNAGSSVWLALAFIPIAWVCAGIGAFIGNWSYNTLAK